MRKRRQSIDVANWWSVSVPLPARKNAGLSWNRRPFQCDKKNTQYHLCVYLLPYNHDKNYVIKQSNRRDTSQLVHVWITKDNACGFSSTTNNLPSFHLYQSYCIINLLEFSFCRIKSRMQKASTFGPIFPKCCAWSTSMWHVGVSRMLEVTPSKEN